MAQSTEELLRKAVLSTTEGTTGVNPSGDFGGTGEAPLSVEQSREFLKIMQAKTPMLQNVRTVTSNAAKWQQSVIEFSGRVMRPGVESTRLSASDRTKPATGKCEINTVLTRGEVPVSDEALEDTVAGGDLGKSIEDLVGNRAGYDIEELFINGDTTSGDAWLAQLDGWIKQCRNGKVASTNVGGGANAIDGAAFGQGYQEIFRALLVSIPDKFRDELDLSGKFSSRDGSR